MHVVLGRLPGRRAVVDATGSPATSASTATRSTTAGCATRAGSPSRRSTATSASAHPLLRESGDEDELVEAPWADALDAAADALLDARTGFGPSRSA